MQPESECSVLSNFQDTIMNLLDSDQEPESIILQLKSDPRFASMKAYLESLDPDMIAVAKELVRKWGVKD